MDKKMKQVPWKQSTPAAMALAHYRAGLEIDRDLGPFEWWWQCALSHGFIAKLVFKYLASPAMTVPFVCK